jgi:formiminoglutamase
MSQSEDNYFSDFEEYFQPIAGSVIAEDFNAAQYGAKIHYYAGMSPFPDIDNETYDIAIIGAGLDQFDLSAGLNGTPNFVRYYLYKLYSVNTNVRIADLGNFSTRTSQEEYCQILSRLISALLNKNIFPIIIGGGRELAYALYLGYARSSRLCNLCDVSASLNFSEVSDVLDCNNVLGKILNEKDSFLFNYSNLGFQGYFCAPELIKLFEGFHFDLMRLGELRNEIRETEPLIRDAHCLSLDLSSVKLADAPNTSQGTPNGISSDEICRIARYAGLSNKLTAAGFFGIKPDGEANWPDLHLMAQVIWHLLEGFYSRKTETLSLGSPPYLKYTVTLNGNPDSIVFHKNELTEKWWMVVPIFLKNREKFKMESYLIPCSERDYITASRGEIPERWIKRYHQLND